MNAITVRGHTVEIRYNGELAQHRDGTWGLAHRFHIDGGPPLDIYGLWDFMTRMGEKGNYKITATLWDLLDGIYTPPEHRYRDTPAPTRWQQFKLWWWSDVAALPGEYAWRRALGQSRRVWLVQGREPI